MKTHHWLILFTAAFTSIWLQSEVLAQPSSATPRVKVRYPAGRSPVMVPVEINNNLILVDTRLNGKRPLKLIFDTGASMTVINADLQNELGIKGTEQASGTATGGNIEGTVARGINLTIGGVGVSNQPIGILAMPRIPGFDFDGAIGFDFIKQFVIEIDYLDKTMILHDPGTYRYVGKGSILPLDLKDRQTPLIKATFAFPGSPQAAARLELDTGGDNAFLLYYPFFNKRKLLKTPNGVESTPGRGAGGETERILQTASRVSLNRFTFSKVPVLFSLQKEGLESGIDGIVGGEILRRFRLIIDYSRRRMIVEPNKDLKSPITVDG